MSETGSTAGGALAARPLAALMTVTPSSDRRQSRYSAAAVICGPPRSVGDACRIWPLYDSDTKRGAVFRVFAIGPPLSVNSYSSEKC